jgi:hypothetical protein
MKWGENKIVFEEALIGSLISAAVGGLVVASILPVGLTRAIAAVSGAVIDPVAEQWGRAHPMLLALGGAAIFSAVLVSFVVGFRLLGWQKQEWHFAGMRLLEGEPMRLASQEREQSLYSQAQTERRVRGVVLGGVELSRTREVGHFSVSGLPGSGKTVLLTAVARQVLERGDRLLIHDPKGDFLDWLWVPSESVVLGPWDARSVPWDITTDIDTPERALTFAASIFSQNDAGANQYFVDAAREVFAAVVKFLQQTKPGTWSWGDLAEILRSGAHRLVGAAHVGDPITRTLIPDPNNKTVQSILSEIVRSTAWIPAYAAAFDDDQRARAFSFTAWLTGKTSASVVLLNNDARYATRAEQLFSSMLHSAASIISSPLMPERSADVPGLWVIADEYPQLGTQAQKAIRTMEEMGRSRGVRVMKAVQDESQLFAAVGREKGEALRSVQQTRIYLKQATGSAAELCQRLGQKEIMRVEFPHIVGGGNKRVVKDRQSVIRVDQLTGLRLLKDGPTPGIEMILHSDDLIGRLMVPFPPEAERKGALVPNERWDAIANVPIAEQRSHAVPVDADLNTEQEAPERDELPREDGLHEIEDHELRDLF